MDQTCPIEPEAKSSRRHLEDVLVLKRNWVTVGVPAFEKKTKQVINEYVWIVCKCIVIIIILFFQIIMACCEKFGGLESLGRTYMSVYPNLVSWKY